MDKRDPSPQTSEFFEKLGGIRRYMLVYYIHYFAYDNPHWKNELSSDIFNIMNVSSINEVSNFFQTIGPAARLQILLAIGAGETCVCHLEAMLGLRQATLSQHLMALREAGLVADRRQGRYIHYRLCNPALLALIRQAADMQGVTLPELAPSVDCCCPDCEGERKRDQPCCDSVG